MGLKGEYLERNTRREHVALDKSPFAPANALVGPLQLLGAYESRAIRTELGPPSAA